MSQVIEQFLEKCDPKDPALRKALGLGNKEMQVFWAGLNAAGDDLAIPDFMKTAGKVVNFPSPYINKLFKAKLLEHGGRGKWSISAFAVKKMEAILKDGIPEVSAKGEKPAAKKVTKRTARPTPKTKKSKSKARGPKKTKMSIDALLDKLRAKISRNDAQIARLSAERDAAQLSIAAIKDALK